MAVGELYSRRIQYLSGYGKEVTALTMLGNTPFLVVGFLAGQLQVVATNQKITIQPQQAHEKPIRKILVLKEGRLFMTFAEDGTIRTWELVVGSLAGNEV